MKLKTVLLSIMFIFLFLKGDIMGKEKWSGVDEAVVEKYAKKYGVEPKEPLINTDQGDMLLFIFTLAGSVGGFVAGYNYRKIFKERRV